MKKTLLYLFFFSSISQFGNAQACGSGIVTFNIYTLNGEEIEDASYEIFPVPKQLVEKYKNLNTGRDSGGGVIGDFKETNLISNDSLNDRLQEYLEHSSITKSGKFKTSLEFQTLEGVYFPIILRVTIKSKTIYIFGNFFGGCDREASLICSSKTLVFL